MDCKDRIDEFTAFFIAYRPKLAAVIARFHPRGRDEIEDVLQDVWIKGAKAWPPRDIKLARSWLGRIAINEAFGRGRRAKRSPMTIGARDDARAIDCRDPAPLPDELAIRRQMHHRLQRAIDRIEKRSPRQVTAMRLVMEGYTYLEAASLMDITEGAAKSQTSKAIEKLRLSLTAIKAA
jgi:RNA polymerase sigma factor (sigma-70 family)